MLSNLSIWQIKSELHKRSLKISGSKNELVLRLTEAIEKDGKSVEEFYEIFSKSQNDLDEVVQSQCGAETGAINKIKTPIKNKEHVQSTENPFSF